MHHKKVADDPSCSLLGRKAGRLVVAFPQKFSQRASQTSTEVSAQFVRLSGHQVGQVSGEIALSYALS